MMVMFRSMARGQAVAFGGKPGRKKARHATDKLQELDLTLPPPPPVNPRLRVLAEKYEVRPRCA